MEVPEFHRATSYVLNRLISHIFKRENLGPFLNLGPFFCLKDSEEFPSNSDLRAHNPLI